VGLRGRDLHFLTYSLQDIVVVSTNTIILIAEFLGQTPTMWSSEEHADFLQLGIMVEDIVFLWVAIQVGEMCLTHWCS
jgi:hypothetical protein